MPETPRPEDQQLPQKNSNPIIQELVLQDIKDRLDVGIQRYGTGLQGNNGRDMLRDLYEELLDACVYTRGLIWEREAADLKKKPECYLKYSLYSYQELKITCNCGKQFISSISKVAVSEFMNHYIEMNDLFKAGT